MRILRPLLSITILATLALLPLLTRPNAAADAGDGVVQAEAINASGGRDPAILQVPTATPTPTPTGNRNGNNNSNDNGCNGNGNDNNSNNNDNNRNGNGNRNGNCNDNNSNSNDNNSNNNSNGNGNSNSNRNGNSNSNGNGNGNGNSNSNGNDNSFSSRPQPVYATPTPSIATATECFNPQQSGSLAINLSGGTATLTVASGAAFAQATMLRLEQADLSSSPQTPGTRVDSFLFNVRAFQGCNGPETTLPSPANLGISFNTPVDKSKVHIAVYQNSQWIDVTVVPDPSPTNAYVSATISATGLYTVYTTP